MKRLAAVLVLALGALAGEEPRFVTIEPKEGGWAVAELLQLVADQTGETLLFDPDDLRDRHVVFSGVQSVPRDLFFDWFRSLLSFERLVLVPGKSEGKLVWSVLRVRDRGCRPVVLKEEGLPRWEDRPDAFVILMMGLRHADPEELRPILEDLTRDPSYRFTSMPGSAQLLIHGPVANLHLLAALVRALDVPSPEALREIERLERLLAEAGKEAAAERLVERIRALRAGN